MGATPHRLKVLIVDHHPVFRQGLCALLEEFADVQVVGGASSGDEAIELAESCAPDVVVVDLGFDEIGGAAFVRRLRRHTPTIGVLVLTTSAEDQQVISLLSAGARGYLLKDAEPATVVLAVRSVALGGAVFAPSIAHRLAAWLSVAPGSRSQQAFPKLTAREHAVLDLVAAGHSNIEIARRLHVSPKTVRNRMSLIIQKLQVPNRANAIVCARKAGMGAVNLGGNRLLPGL